MNLDRTMAVGEVFRYTKPNGKDLLAHPHRNFWALQSGQSPRVMLESGINATKDVIGPDGSRMPLLALRSSPGKAGSHWTPWHDEFDLVGGKIRYFGDHRVDTLKQLGETPGDRRLETTWRSHRAASEAIRRSAPPILVFKTVTGQTAAGPHEKGFVEFVGLAVMTDLRVIEQRDAPTGRHFTNYVTELALLELGGDDRLSWEWLDARRDPSLSNAETLAFAPDAWQAWVRLGTTALPASIRHRDVDEAAPRRAVIDEQWPTVSTEVDPFTFPWVAARAVEQLLGVDRTRMLAGIERSGSVTFRGIHRLGAGAASASLRVVAVAARGRRPALEAASRLVRDLQPGQIGVITTPAELTTEDITSLKAPGSTLIVLSGETFAAQVMRMAEQSFDGDVSRLEPHLAVADSAEPAHLG